jgi:hypothetical protein
LREYVLRKRTATHLTKDDRKPDDAGSRDSATGTDGCVRLTKGERAYLEIVAAESGREIPLAAFEFLRGQRHPHSQGAIKDLENRGLRGFRGFSISCEYSITHLLGEFAYFRNS